MSDNRIGLNVGYDKFLMIEGWAYRGRKLIEKGEEEKAKGCAKHIGDELKILRVILKLEEVEK